VLNESSFHVPLLLHYPRAFPAPVAENAVTSHVDVAPSVLALLGIDPGALPLQGRPMSDPAIADRVTYFLGTDFFGVSGAHYQGWFFQENELAGLAFLNRRFLFRPEHLITSTDAESADARRAEFFRERLRGLERLQWGWIRYLSGRPVMLTASPR